MKDFSNNNFNQQVDTPYVNTDATVKSFFSNVFTYMAGALAITGLLAYWFGSSETLLRYLIDFDTGSMTGLGWVAMLAPIGFYLIMAFAFERFSSFGLLLLFIGYSAAMGISLSFIFLIYSLGSIVSTFFISAATFGAMAVVGYTTKQDLTKFGTILIMALIGLIIAMVVNMFMQSEMLYYIISSVGVLIFTGLTAYKVQQLKRIGSGVEYGSESSNKLAIMGAFSLYITFINLFMMLLRIFGDRR